MSGLERIRRLSTPGQRDSFERELPNMERLQLIPGKGYVTVDLDETTGRVVATPFTFEAFLTQELDRGGKEVLQQFSDELRLKESSRGASLLKDWYLRQVDKLHEAAVALDEVDGSSLLSASLSDLKRAITLQTQEYLGLEPVEEQEKRKPGPKPEATVPPPDIDECVRRCLQDPRFWHKSGSHKGKPNVNRILGQFRKEHPEYEGKLQDRQLTKRIKDAVALHRPPGVD